MVRWWVVDTRPEPQRIEIELTSHAPATGRRAAATRALPVESTQGDSGDEQRPNSTERDDRRRLIVTGLAAGAAALLLGWILGRAGGDPDVATTGSSIPTETSIRSSLPLTGDALPTPLITVPRTTIVRPSTTTSTVLANEIVLIDEALLGFGVRIVGVEMGGNLIEVDADTGFLHRLDLEMPVGGPVGLAVGIDTAIIMNHENGTAVSVVGDEPAEPNTFLASGQLFAAPESGTLWRIAFESTGRQQTAEEVAIDGTPTGVTIELPGYPILGDPVGGVVVGLPGGSFSITPSGVELLTSGNLVAIGRDKMLSVRCETTLICSMYVTDRSTKQETRLPTVLETPDSVQSIGWWGNQSGGVSPDDRAAVIVHLADPRNHVYELALVDLETGELTTLTVMDTTSVAWSNDGRFALFLESGLLYAYDRDTGNEFVVSHELSRLSAVAVRPAG